MVIWFNQWFSTIYHNIRALKNNLKKSDTLIVSSNNPNQLYMSLGDIRLVDPLPSDPDEYVEYALWVCKEYKVDIFFPKKYLEAIAMNKDKFTSLGTKIIVEDTGVYEAVRSKYQVYKKLGIFQFKHPNLDEVGIPPCVLCHDPEALEHHLNSYLDMDIPTCIKLDIDSAAKSFRTVSNEPDNNTFSHYIEMGDITVAEAVKSYERMLKDRPGKPNDILVMPYLQSPEVSIDCYNSPYGFIGMSRVKSERIQKISTTDPLIKKCETIQKCFNLQYPFNVQFRLYKGEPVLLEINPRLAGGSCYSLVTGIDFVSTIVTGKNHVQRTRFEEPLYLAKLEEYVVMEDYRE